MKAVITVIGKDTVGILAKTSGAVAEVNGNVIEVNQSVMQDFFAMIMLIDITEMTVSVDELKTILSDRLDTMEIHVMHEDIFNSMHRI